MYYLLTKGNGNPRKCGYHIAEVRSVDYEKEQYECNPVGVTYNVYTIPFSNVMMTDTNLSLIKNTRKHLKYLLENKT